MRWLRAVGRWASDWRTGAVLLGSLVVGAVIALIIVSGVNTHDALEARNRTAEAATRRIDKLSKEIDKLTDELVATTASNGQRIGELTAQIAALQEQVRELGGRPVVPATTTTVAQRAPTSTTTTRPPQTTPTTSTTTTSPPRRCVIGVVCLER
jgi:predicted GTPase